METKRLVTLGALEARREATAAEEFDFARCCEAISKAEIPSEFCRRPRGSIARRITANVVWEIGITGADQMYVCCTGPLSKRWLKEQVLEVVELEVGGGMACRLKVEGEREADTFD